MTNQLTFELSEEIGFCSGGLASTLMPFYQFPDSKLDNAIIENYAFLLAYLCMEGGIDFDEAGSCLACFVGIHLQGNREKYMSLGKSMQFYHEQLSMLGKDDFFVGSCICFNLLNPGSLRSFSQSIPLQSMNCLTIVEAWTMVKSFLKEQLPKRVNPILDKL